MEHSETRSRADTAKRCCAHLGFEKSATVYIPVRFALFPYPHLYNIQKIWVGSQMIQTLSCFNYFLDAANFTVEWGCDPWIDCGKHVVRGKISTNSLDFSADHSIIKVCEGFVCVQISAWDYWRVLWKNLSC